MKLKIVLDEGAFMPVRAHVGDAGLDIFAAHGGVIPPYGSAAFGTGLHVAVPENYVGFLKSRSGTMFSNSVVTDGTIDHDYTGEIKVKLFNNCGARFVVERGQKIAQLVLLPIITPELEVVEELSATERGDNGFGSTGK